ncbi:MAG TPA: restriction endonuclease subunit S [Gemmataceae bacterium]|jgi:type I restriction enzyme S subunit
MSYLHVELTEHPLPDGWYEDTLAACLDRMSSGSRPSGGSELDSSGVFSLGGEHIDDFGGFRFGNCTYVPEKHYEWIKLEADIQLGDILLNKDGAKTGKVAFVDDTFPFPRACINEHVFRIRARTSTIRNDYLFYFLLSSFGQTQLCRNIQGSAQPGINQRFPRFVRVRFPISTDEQDRIAETLKAADDHIRALEEQIRKAERVKKALLQQFPCAVRHGARVPLFRFSEISSGFTKGRDLSGYERLTVAYLTVVNVLEGALDLTEVSTADIKVSELDDLRLRDGDILMTEGGDRDKLGRGCIWQGQIDPIVCQNHIFRVRVNKKELRPWFLHYLLQAPSSKRYFFSAAKQTNNLCTINSRDLRRFEVPRLDPSQQDQWIERMRASDALIASLQKQLTAARRVKQSLLQNLLIGKIRLKP